MCRGHVYSSYQYPPSSVAKWRIEQVQRCGGALTGRVVAALGWRGLRGMGARGLRKAPLRGAGWTPLPSRETPHVARGVNTRGGLTTGDRYTIVTLHSASIH